MKKQILACVLALVTALSLDMLAGCSGQNDEQVIRDGITQELDTYKNLEGDTLASVVDSMGADQFSQFGIDAEEFVRSFFSDFDYTIDSITVEDDTADVVVTFSNKSISGFEDAVNGIVDEMTNDESLADMSYDEFTALYGQRVMEALDNVEPATADPVTITCVKSDNTWAVDSSASQEILEALVSI